MAYYLVGIGEVRAKAIVKQRGKAKFKTIEDVKNVEGIGEAIFDGIRKNISTSKGETTVPKEDKKVAAKKSTVKAKTEKTSSAKPKAAKKADPKKTGAKSSASK